MEAQNTMPVARAWQYFGGALHYWEPIPEDTSRTETSEDGESVILFRALDDGGEEPFAEAWGMEEEEECAS